MALTSVGCDNRKFICTSSLKIQIAADTNITAARFYFEIGDFLVTIAKCVVDHCIDATIWISRRNL